MKFRLALSIVLDETATTRSNLKIMGSSSRGWIKKTRQSPPHRGISVAEIEQIFSCLDN